MRKKSLICLFLALVCVGMLFTGCSDEPITLKYDATSGGYIDSENDVTYLRAPTYYEAVGLDKNQPYATLGDKETDYLYRMQNADPTHMIANSYFEIFYREGTVLPRLWEMGVGKAYVGRVLDGASMDLTDTVIEDSHDLSILIGQYQKGTAVSFDASDMLEGNRALATYRIRFESAQYPAFYFCLRYYQYEKDVVVYEVIDSKEGFVPTYAGALSVEFDESYIDKYGELYAVYHFGTNILCDPITGQCFAVGDTVAKHFEQN